MTNDKARVVRTPSPNKAVWSTYDHGKDDGAKAERQRIRRAQRDALWAVRRIATATLLPDYENIHFTLMHHVDKIDQATRATKGKRK